MANASKGRRRGGENSETRALLLDAAEKLILEEGYASVTTRRLAEKASLKSQLVHYYFKSIDDVFVAVIRRRVSRNLKNMMDIVMVEKPLDALWKVSREKEAVVFWQELLALANHRKVIRDEVRLYTEQRRLLQAAILERSFKLGQVESRFPPIAWAILVEGISYVLSAESTLGLSAGHEDALFLIEDVLKDGLGILEKTHEDL